MLNIKNIIDLKGSTTVNSACKIQNPMYGIDEKRKRLTSLSLQINVNVMT